MGIVVIQTADGSHSLLHEELKETFHSTNGAIQESLYVFIQHGLRPLIKNYSKHEIHILEMGLGTGLNALLTLQVSIQENIRINYTAIEAYPLEDTLLSQLNYVNLLSFERAPELYRNLHLCEWNTSVQMHEHFIFTKKLARLEDVNLHAETFDLVYYDAFAPSRQPELWDFEILERIAKSMKPKSLLTTYCAKGQVKRDLRSLGLTVETLDGPPGKKEMIRATKGWS